MEGDNVDSTRYDTSRTKTSEEFTAAESRVRGAAFFQEGRYIEAYEVYTEALTTSPDNPTLLNNRSAALFRLHRFNEAVADAQRSVDILTASAGEQTVDNDWIVQLAKAYYRQASALHRAGELTKAVSSFRKGLKVLPGERGLAAGLQEVVEDAYPLEQLAYHFAELIHDAESPSQFSARDGKVLKPVFPTESRLPVEETIDLLRSAMQGHEHIARGALVSSYVRGKKVLRHFLAAFRSWAYLKAQRPGQAMKDAQTAVAWSKTKSSPDGWAQAHYLLALAIEAVEALEGASTAVVANPGEAGRKYTLTAAASTAAALSMRRAFEADPEDALFASELKRLVKRIPREQRDVLLKDGAVGLMDWLETQKWDNAPEYLRPRPKYYYYYEWMKDRIHEHYPALPQPIMDKLLATDAQELDLLLQYPQAIKGQVEEYLEVYRQNGGEYLETYRTPTLTWEEVKALKGPGTVGLGTGYNAPGEGFLPAEKNTNHALVGSAGDGGLTEAEKLGLPAATTLPPDHMRDHYNVETATNLQHEKLLEDGGLGSAASTTKGRHAAIMAAAEQAAMSAAETRKTITQPVEGGGDLEGID